MSLPLSVQLANLHTRHGDWPDPSRATGYLKLKLLAERVRRFRESLAGFGREPSWEKDRASNMLAFEEDDFLRYATTMRAAIRSRIALSVQQGSRKDAA